MGLYEQIKADLLKNNGTKTKESLYEQFNKSYSKQTISDILHKNSDDFVITNNDVSLKDYKIHFFIKSLDNLLKKEQRFAKNQLELLAELFVENKQSGFEEMTPRNTLFGESIEEGLRIKFNNLFSIISNEDWENKGFVYKLSAQFYSQLLSFSRQNRTLFSTPGTLIDLILRLIPSRRELEIYNPASGVLKLLSAIFAYSDADIMAYGSEIDPEIHNFGQYMGRANNVKGFIDNNDSLQDWKWKKKKFDLIVCNPPFNSKLGSYHKYDFPYSDVSLNIISNSLHNLKNDGVAIFLIPENVLFGSSREFRNFRREIVESRILKTIISLPTNLFATITSIKTSLLVFDKSWQKDKIQFLDASLKKYYTTQKDKSIKLDTDRIIDRIRPLEVDGKTIVKEALVQYNSSDFKEVSTSEIQENKYSLQIRNYTSYYPSFEGENYKELGSILKPIDLKKAQKNQFPYIRISELNGDKIESSESIQQNTTRSVGKVINQQSILIGTVGGSHKPTLFAGNFSAELSKNVLALQPIEEHIVFLPYLVQELNKKYVVDQMTYLAVGATTLRHLRREDLFKVKVKFPDIKTQIQIYESRLGFVPKETDDQNNGRLTDDKLFGTIKHEIGNILRGPSGFLDLLPKFLENNNILLDQPISQREGAESIGKKIEKASSKIQEAYSVLDNLRGVLSSEQKYFQPKNQELRSYLRNRIDIENFANNIEYFIGVNGIYNKPTNIFAEFDDNQFKYVVRNICLNAIKHGGNSGKLSIVINIESIQDRIQINFINNGNPFPSNFTIDDYIGFGRKGGDSEGTGLGGYVTNQIVRNHQGTLELLPAGEMIKVSYDSIEKRIKANVAITITIPKKQ